MRISDRYIGWQVLVGTIYAVVALGAILVLGNLFQKVQPLLVDMKAPPALVLKFALHILPVSLIYTLPWGFLSSVLLVFGRMSVQQEITGFRVAGVSLPRLAAPVFFIAAGLSALSLWINTRVVPQSKYTTNQLLFEQASRNPDSLLKPGVVRGDLGGDSSFVGKLLVEGKDGNWLEGFHLYQFPNNGEGWVSIQASRAAFRVDREKSRLTLKLINACISWPDGRQQVEGDLTMDIANQTPMAHEGQVLIAGKIEPLLLDLKKPTKKDNAMTNQELRAQIAAMPPGETKQRVKYRAEITKRQAFSFACLAFAFVAVPLGINSRRKDSSLGLVYSLLIGIAYFVLTVLGEDVRSVRWSTLVIWLPNVLCVVLGVMLFRRAKYK